MKSADILKELKKKVVIKELKQYGYNEMLLEDLEYEELRRKLAMEKIRRGE